MRPHVLLSPNSMNEALKADSEAAEKLRKTHMGKTTRTRDGCNHSTFPAVVQGIFNGGILPAPDPHFFGSLRARISYHEPHAHSTCPAMEHARCRGVISGRISGELSPVITLKLPDGSTRQVAPGARPREVA